MTCLSRVEEALDSYLIRYPSCDLDKQRPMPTCQLQGIQNPKEACLLISAREDSAAKLQPGPWSASTGKAEGRMKFLFPGNGFPSGRLQLSYQAIAHRKWGCTEISEP